MQPDDESIQPCLCGSVHFERVKVDRPGGPYVTQFLACRFCGVMFYVPVKPGAWGAAAVVPTSPPRRT